MFDNNGVLILECIDRPDPGSEGRFLSHMFDLMEVLSQYIEVRIPQQLLALIKSSPFDVIHITTHGFLKTKGAFRGWWTPGGIVGINKLEDVKGALSGKLLVSTACRSGDDRFSESVRQVLGCKYYIAPKGRPKFHNAIFFAHVFYHKLFVLSKSVTESYNSYVHVYKNPHDFYLFKAKKKTS